MSGTDRFHDPAVVAGLLERIARAVDALGRPVTFMEVCGSHTHAIAAAGLRHRLPGGVRLISGPGCPVCVTPVGYLDRAWALAGQHGAVLATFGDLMRVPSSRGSLELAAARGAAVRIVYSPRDALRIAEENPGRPVVFLGIGFETTAPTIAAALEEAERKGISNFSVLPGNKVMPPPLAALAGAGDVAVDGFILPGHVSVVTGSGAFEFLPERFGLPGAVAGFTPADVLRAVEALIGMLAAGKPRIVNLYGRVVRPGGNRAALELMDRVFEPVDAVWRGLGPIPASGLGLAPAWAHRDASRLPVELPRPVEPPGCRCGEVLRGTLDPPECALFGRTCTPDNPVGACMVSSEGSCAAWYRHERWTMEGTA